MKNFKDLLEQSEVVIISCHTQLSFSSSLWSWFLTSGDKLIFRKSPSSFQILEVSFLKPGSLDVVSQLRYFFRHFDFPDLNGFVPSKSETILFFLPLIGLQTLLVSMALPLLNRPLKTLEKNPEPPNECLILENKLLSLSFEIFDDFKSSSSIFDNPPNNGPKGSSSGSNRLADKG